MTVFNYPVFNYPYH